MGDSRGDYLTARIGPKHLSVVMVSQGAGIVLLKKWVRGGPAQGLLRKDRQRWRRPSLFSLFRFVQGLFRVPEQPMRLLLTRTSRSLARRDVRRVDSWGARTGSGLKS